MSCEDGLLGAVRLTLAGRSTGQIGMGRGGAGESYTGSELYHRSNGTAEAGDETLIWYDPENPAHSSYHKPGPGLDPYGVYFLMAPLAVAWLAENHRKS